MLANKKSAIIVVLVIGVIIGFFITARLDYQPLAEAATANVPLGRTPGPIVDGQYPASYFPNTELLGADEMRITALGTGMPNMTRAAASRWELQRAT